MDEIVTEFLVESYENLDRLDRDFVELEKNPSKEALGSIFRAIHTIKGTCGFLGLGKLESVTHVGESLLSLLRDGALQVSPKIIDALLAMVDAVRQMLASIEATGHEGDRNDSALIETLRSLQKLDETSTVTVPPSPAPLPSAVISTSPPQKRKILRRRPIPRARHRGLRNQRSRQFCRRNRSLTGCQSIKGKFRGPRSTMRWSSKPKAIRDGLVKFLFNRQQSRPPNWRLCKTRVKRAPPWRTAPSASTSRLLDKLMNLVGELVLARNQILQFTASQRRQRLCRPPQHLNLVTTELQEGVMKTRMQPIGNVWNRVSAGRARPGRGLRQASAREHGGRAKPSSTSP